MTWLPLLPVYLIGAHTFYRTLRRGPDVGRGEAFVGALLWVPVFLTALVAYAWARWFA